MMLRPRPRFTCKKQVQSGKNQGKWCIYRPDGIRFVVGDTQRHADQLCYAMNLAVLALEAQGKAWTEIIAVT